MSVLKKYFAILFIGGLVLFLIRSGRQGADFLAYFEWSKALSTGDIFQFATNTLSPQFLPLSQHAPVAGYLFAAPKLFLFSGMPLLTSTQLAGFAATVTLWICAFSLFMDFSNGSMSAVLFGFAVMFIGTHAGWQASVYASENFAVTALAVAMASLDLKAQSSSSGVTIFRALVFSCCAGLLLTLKPNLGIYAVAGGVMLLVRLRRSSGSIGRKVMVLVAAAAPMAAAAAWIPVQNLWMTGDWRRSPYQFGDAQFSSIAWTHPLFGAALLHPYHGLLLFHPLYGLMLLVLALYWIKRRFGAEKAFYAVATFGMALNAWLQAGWYGWWMGVDTFGGRGFATYLILLTPLLVGFLAGLPRGRIRAMWLAATCACVLWSFPILIGGVPVDLTYGQFFADYARSCYRALLEQPENILLIPAIYAGARLFFSRDPKLRSDSGFLGLVCAAWALVFIVLFHAWHNAHPHGIAAFPAHPAAPDIIARVLKAAAIAMLPLFVAQAIAHAGELRRAGRMALTLVFVLTVMIFAGAVVAFGKLYVATEAARGNPLVRPCYEYQSDFLYTFVGETSLEYEAIPGFDAPKANLRRFLEERGKAIDRIDLAPMSTADCLARAGHVPMADYWIGEPVWRTIRGK